MIPTGIQKLIKDHTEHLRMKADRMKLFGLDRDVWFKREMMKWINYFFKEKAETLKLECNKCGECCYYQDGKERVVCLHLKDNECLIYEHRIGVEIGVTQKGEKKVCGYRVNHPFKYKDCPYNDYIKE